jgi:acyl carrier protein
VTDADVRAAVLLALRRIAPEIDSASIRGDVAIREQVDLDSMDFLNFVIELNKSLGVDVPESDYEKLATLDTAVAYLWARTGS